jgi:tetratricopeptide (TPR) repeat protein
MKRRLVVLLFLVSAGVAAGTALAADLKDIYADAQRDFRRGAYESAAAEWTRIISPEPTDTGGEVIDLASVYYNRGLTYKKLLKWKEASDDFSMALGLNPNDAEAFYQRAGCYEKLGLSDKASADILRACELKDDYCTEKMLEQKRGNKNENSWGHR